MVENDDINLHLYIPLLSGIVQLAPGRAICHCATLINGRPFGEAALVKGKADLVHLLDRSIEAGL